MAKKLKDTTIYQVGITGYDYENKVKSHAISLFRRFRSSIDKIKITKIGTDTNE